MIDKELLSRISEKSITLGDFDFSKDIIERQWIGDKPATKEEILCLEKRLDIKLPTDYLTFLSISNGFAAPCASEPTFVPTTSVDYLENIDSELIDTWRETGNVTSANILFRSICIGNANKEQYFLLVPPMTSGGAWLYWKFAHWIPGEEPFDGLKDYFEYIESFMEDII